MSIDALENGAICAPFPAVCSSDRECITRDAAMRRLELEHTVHRGSTRLWSPDSMYARWSELRTTNTFVLGSSARRVCEPVLRRRAKAVGGESASSVRVDPELSEFDITAKSGESAIVIEVRFEARKMNATLGPSLAYPGRACDSHSHNVSPWRHASCPERHGDRKVRRMGAPGDALCHG
jgi:hypothetical protein